MRVDQRLLAWGLFLVLLGAIPLSVSQGLVAPETVSRWWTLWPLLLIAAGLGLLLRRTSFGLVGGLLTAATLGLIGGGLLASVPNLSISCGPDAGAVAFDRQEGRFAEAAQVRLEMTCGEVRVVTAAGDAWRLQGSDADGSGPRVDAAADRLTVRSANRDAGIDPLGSRDVWTVTLPAGPELDLGLELNAGRGEVRLDEARLGRARIQLNVGDLRLVMVDVASATRIDVEVNAGRARLELPAGTITGRFNINAGSLDFCLPEGVALRIRTEGNVLAAHNFESRGLVASGNTWETPGFANAAVGVELDVNANAGSVNLNPTGGC